MKKNIDAGLLVLRLSIGILMLLHGIAKIQNGVSGTMGLIENAGLPAALGYLIYIGEVLAPLMLIAGFRSRLGALLVAGTMAFVMVFIQPDKFGQITPTGAWGLEVQGLFLFGSMAILIAGGGKYAVSTRSKWD